MHIATDEDLRAFARKENPNDPVSVIAGVRLEECYELLVEAGLITREEYRGGPDFRTLTLALGRARKAPSA
jgi:hypothetical protein